MKSLTALLLATISIQASAQVVNRTMIHDGLQREYAIYVPPSYTGEEAWPLVVSMHGNSTSLDFFIDATAMDHVADREGFLVVYPNGVDRRWTEGHDHIGFIDRVIDAIQADYAVDSSRVYATGHSSGGGMALALGLMRPDKFAAVAKMPGGGRRVRLDATATYPPQIPTLPRRPYPLLGMAGTADPISLYDGDEMGGLPKEQFIAEWATANGSQSPLTFQRLPDLDPNDGTTVDLYSCPDCDTYVGVSGQVRQAEVRLYRINGGGHGWPDERDKWPADPRVHPITGDISASAEMWNFFKDHELSAAPEPSPFSIVASTHSIWDLNLDEIGDRTNTRRRTAIGGIERIITKFDLPNLRGQQLENATLRVYLEDLVGTPPSAISVFHSLTDNDLDQVVSDYHDESYVDTALTLAAPDAATGEFYEVDVTDLIHADYAADGDDPTTAFRLQVMSVGDDPLSNYYSIANSSLYARNPTLILTTVPNQAAIPGDYNGNGEVEQGDLDLVLLHWGSDTIPAAWTNNPPEGAVDQQELDAVLLNWGRGAPLGANAVPEPSSVILAILLSVATVIAVFTSKSTACGQPSLSACRMAAQAKEPAQAVVRQ